MKPLLRVALAGVAIAVAAFVLQDQDDTSSASQPLEPQASESGAGKPAQSERQRDEALERVAVEPLQSERGAETVTGETEIVALAEGTAVVGRVVDEGGTPVERADVHLERDGARLASGNRTTDEQGRFTLVTRASGEALLWARKASVGLSETTSLILPVQGRIDIGDVVLLGDGEIAGRVVLPNGRPIETFGLLVRARDTEGGPGLRSARGTTDSEGRFHFRGLALGEFVIEPRPARAPQFDGEPHLSTGELEAVLVLRAVRLTVRAEDRGGNALGMTELAIRPHGGLAPRSHLRSVAWSVGSLARGSSTSMPCSYALDEWVIRAASSRSTTS